jgi:hypothetical protein
MTDDPELRLSMFDPADSPDPEHVYANSLRTCEMLRIEPVPRERAIGLIGEWTEVLIDRGFGRLQGVVEAAAAVQLPIASTLDPGREVPARLVALRCWPRSARVSRCQ